VNVVCPLLVMGSVGASPETVTPDSTSPGGRCPRLPGLMHANNVPLKTTNQKIPGLSIVERTSNLADRGLREAALDNTLSQHENRHT
jgi:hypothetical protein